MEYKEIKDLSSTELKKRLGTASEESFVAKMKNSMGQLSNPLEIRFMRKNIARLHTALTAQRKANPEQVKAAAAPAAKKAAPARKPAAKKAAPAAKKTKTSARD